MNLMIFSSKQTQPRPFRSLILVLGLGLFSFLVACQLEPDPGFFDEDSACQPPCWQDIRPGLTTQTDAFTTLADSQLIEPGSLKATAARVPDFTSAKFSLEGAGSVGSLTFADGIVYGIWLRPKFNLQLVDVLAHFGEPDYVYAQDFVTDERCYDAHLYYIEQGLMIMLFGCLTVNEHGQDEWATNEFKLAEETEVTDIVYFPSTLQTFENELLYLWGFLGDAEETVAHITRHAQPWSGYATYPSASQLGGLGKPPLP